MLKAIISSWTLFFGLLLISAGTGLQVVEVCEERDGVVVRQRAVCGVPRGEGAGDLMRLRLPVVVHHVRSRQQYDLLVEAR